MCLTPACISLAQARITAVLLVTLVRMDMVRACEGGCGGPPQPPLNQRQHLISVGPQAGGKGTGEAFDRKGGAGQEGRNLARGCRRPCQERRQFRQREVAGRQAVACAKPSVRLLSATDCHECGQRCPLPLHRRYAALAQQTDGREQHSSSGTGGQVSSEHT